MTYSSSQRGMATAAIAMIVAFVLIGAGTAYYFSTRTTPRAGHQMVEKQMTEQKDTIMEKDISPTSASGDTIMKKEGETMMKKEEGAKMEQDKKDAMVKYSGTILAGTAAPLLDFTKADFTAAMKSGKLVVLYFYANWCPICREEFPQMQSAFNELATDQVVGFRVNFNDNQTDADEQALAREYGIAYQHTKVFLKNGQQFLKSPESWTKARYLTETNQAID